ncbi:DUF2610 domain-containing protein [Candidatus Lariskella endosymbiont of Hedychridium roseum]|uniref:DUF2610 domain-containing protein n=1 Tax=Candidatus Lariskella endosymbiont of Hedychridium roseum TaxID=3077949 RepID=UPI0030CE55F3
MTELKKFDIPCFFNGAKQTIAVFLGDSAPDHHPLHFQAEWITKDKGGQIPQDIMETVAKIQDLAKRSNVPFMDLWQYALEASSNQSIEYNSESKSSENKISNSIQQLKG